MAHDVFISYSSKNKAIADAVCAGLEAERIRCWIAPRDVLPGGNYGESIVHAMAACRVVVLVFSSATNTSSAVLREMERAMHHGLPIIPFRLEDIPMSPGLEFFLASCHWLDAMHPPVERHIAKLVHATQALLGREASPEPVFSPRPAARKERLMPALLAGAALAAAGFGYSSLRTPAVQTAGAPMPVESGRVSMELSVVEAGRGAITEHFQGSGLSGVRREVRAAADGSLTITDSCGYLELWRNGSPLKPVTLGSQGYFQDAPLLLELKFLNSTRGTVYFTRAVAEVERSESMAAPLIAIEAPKGNELALVSLGEEVTGPVNFQVAIAGPEDALDDARLPAPVPLEFRDGRAVFPLTNVPPSGESTAFGQFVIGDGPQRMMHRFEIPLGVKAPKPPGSPSVPETGYQLELRSGGGPYETECPVSQFIQPGEADRFLIRIAAPQTSSHRFRLHLEYDDGGGAPKRLSGPWIDASLFVENEIR